MSQQNETLAHYFQIPKNLDFMEEIAPWCQLGTSLGVALEGSTTS